jgi:2-methylcitrate dehydratase
MRTNRPRLLLQDWLPRRVAAGISLSAAQNSNTWLLVMKKGSCVNMKQEGVKRMKKTIIGALFSIIVLSGILVAVSLIALGPVAAQQVKVEGPPTDTAAWALAKYAVGLKYEDLPPDVVAITKRRILDAVGGVYGAYNAPSMAILRSVLMSEGAKPESTIIGSGQMTDAANATIVNGSMIYYANFSDTYWSADKGYMHPSTSISEALAVAERQHASGKDLILATVLAYEMQSRLADTFRWPGFEQHTAGGLAAAVAAGKLLGLNSEQMANAIGIGWAHSFIITGQYGVGYTSNEKDLGETAAAANGVLAALLAQKGFTGPVTIIESYQRAFEKNASLAPLVDPRKDFAITKTWMKPFSEFHVSESATTGVIQITKEHNVKPDQIQRVFVRGLPGRRDTGITRNAEMPTNESEASLNLSYVLAMGIIDGEVGRDQFAKEQWKDPKVQELMGKMEFQGDAELTKPFPERWTCIVEITTKDGQTYTQRIDLPKGGPDNPFTDQELEAKFNEMATKLMPKAQSDQIIKACYDLDKLKDVSELTKLLKVTKN